MKNSLYTENLVFHTPEVRAANLSDLDINFIDIQTEIAAPQTATTSPEINLLTANETDLLTVNETQLFPPATKQAISKSDEIITSAVAAPVETNSQTTTETLFSAEQPTTSVEKPADKIILPQIKSEPENQTTTERIAAVRAAIRNQQIEQQNREWNRIQSEQQAYYGRLSQHQQYLSPNMSFATSAFQDEKARMVNHGRSIFGGKSIASALTPPDNPRHQKRINRSLSKVLQISANRAEAMAKRQQTLNSSTKISGFDTSSLYTRMETGLDRNSSNAQRAA